MVVRSTMSVLTGLVVWSFALVAGIELATAWGVIAFVLNYILVHWSACCDSFSNALCSRPVRLMAGLFCRVCVPEFYPIFYWELPGAADRRCCAVHFTIYRPARCLFMEFSLGRSGSFYGRAYHNCNSRGLRTTQFDRVDRISSFWIR